MSDTQLLIDAFWHGGVGQSQFALRLPYEPRAVWQCQRCDLILAGTKDGQVFVRPGPSETSAQFVQVRRAGGRFDPVRALAGCPRCGPNAWVGDAAGHVHRIVFTASKAAYEFAGSPHQVAGNDHGRVIGMTIADDRLVVLFNDGSLYRFSSDPAHAACEPLAAPGRPFRWVFSDGGEEGAALWLVGADGAVARFDPAKDIHPRLEERGLRALPECIATERDPDGRLVAILYGSARGASVWWPRNDDGPAFELSLPFPAAVRFIRRVTVFADAPGGCTAALVVGGADGTVRTWAWDTNVARAMRTGGSFAEPARTPWPNDDNSEVLNVLVTASQSVEDGRVGVRTALYFLRHHDVYERPLYDLSALRRFVAEHGDVAAKGLIACEGGPRKLAAFVRATFGTKGGQTPATEVHLRAVILEVASPGDGSGGHDPDALVELGFSVLVAARSLSPLAVARLARLARRMVLRHMRGAEPSTAWHLALQWSRFLRKHFLLARTYDEKIVRVDDLLAANEGRSPVDALIYAARLAADGIVVDQRWPLSVEPASVAWRDDGELHLAAALRDGSIQSLTALGAVARTPSADDSITRTDAPRAEPLRSAPAGHGSFRDYSNVLFGHEGGWWSAPRAWRDRKHDGGGPPLTKPDPSLCEVKVESGTRGEAGASSNDDVHAAVRADGGWLLGTRSPSRPLAWLEGSPSGGSAVARPLRVDREQWQKRPFGRPRQRLLRALDGSRRLFAVGGDDGVLRIVSVTGAGERRSVSVLRSISVGRQIRAGDVWIPKGKDGLERSPLLVLGTEDGEVFCLEISSADGLRPRVQFRDRLLAPVVAIAVVTFGSDVEAAVLDRNGRISWYCLNESNSDEQTYRGRRMAQRRVIGRGTSMCALSDGSLLVGGHGNKTPEVRLVRRWTDRKDAPDRVAAALGWCEKFAVGQADPRAACLGLLLALPHRDGAVAAILSPEVLGTAPTDGILADAVADGVRARPADRLEFKALLAHLRGVSDRARCLEQKLPPIEVIAKGLGDQERPGDWRASGKRRAALSRKTTCPTLLALASPVGPAECTDPERTERRMFARRVRAWIEDLIFDADPLVRLVTLQSLRATLGGLSRSVRRGALRDAAIEEVFPRYRCPGGPPTVTGAAWLIDVVGRFLREFPPESDDEIACNVESWTAVITVYHLIELYSDAAMTILHQLAVLGVSNAVFRMLERRFGASDPGAAASARQGPVSRSIHLYSPWSAEAPSLSDVFRYCNELRDFPRYDAGGHVDQERAKAQLEIYAVVESLGMASGGNEIANVDLERIVGEPLCAVAWLSAPSSHGEDSAPEKRLFYATKEWFQAHIVPLQEGLRRADDKEAFLRETLRPKDAASGETSLPLRDLFEPERGAMAAVVRQWRSLVDEPVPRPGLMAGKWQLGERLAADVRRRTFKVAGAGDDFDDANSLLIQVHYESPVQEIDYDRARFHALRDAAAVAAMERGRRILPVREVVHRGQQTWLVMDYLEGYHPLGRQAAAAAAEQLRRARKWGTPEILDAFVQWVEDVAAAVNALHDRNLCHGDLASRNLLISGRHPRLPVAIIDFETVRWFEGSGETLRTPTSRSFHETVPGWARRRYDDAIATTRYGAAAEWERSKASDLLHVLDAARTLAEAALGGPDHPRISRVSGARSDWATSVRDPWGPVTHGLSEYAPSLCEVVRSLGKIVPADPYRRDADASPGTKEGANRRALVQLLLELFDSEELRSFVDRYYEALTDHLPGRGASRADVASKAVTLLWQNGLVNHDLFHRLSEERPRRLEEIERVRDACSRDPACREG